MPALAPVILDGRDLTTLLASPEHAHDDALAPFRKPRSSATSRPQRTAMRQDRIPRFGFLRREHSEVYHIAPRAPKTSLMVVHSLNATPAALDERIAGAAAGLVVVYLWGPDCPNCVIFKRSLPKLLQQLADVNFEFWRLTCMPTLKSGVRYGVFGIPHFLLFKGGKKLGKMAEFRGESFWGGRGERARRMNVNRLLPLARAVRSARSLPDAARAALTLARSLGEDLRLLFQLDQKAPSDGLLGRVLGMPLELSAAGENRTRLVRGARISIAARPELSGDIAVILAQAGRRDEALKQVEANLSRALNPYVAEAKAGDAYRALGEPDAAEAYYRRALAIANNDSDRSEAVLRITSFLLDVGRVADAEAFVKAQRRAPPH